MIRNLPDIQTIHIKHLETVDQYIDIVQFKAGVFFLCPLGKLYEKINNAIFIVGCRRMFLAKDFDEGQFFRAALSANGLVIYLYRFVTYKRLLLLEDYDK